MNTKSFLNRISPLWILILFAAAPLCHASELVLVKDGAPQAVIVAASDAQGAARRLAGFISHETSATLAIVAPSTPASKDKLEIVLCSPATRKEVDNRLTPALRTLDLSSEGFVIDIQATPNRGRILLMGTRDSAASPRWTDPAGLRYAVGELWNYRLRLNGKTLTATAALHIEDKPAFPKRIFWNWDFMTNWDDSLKKVHQTSSIDPGGSLTPYLDQPDGYYQQFSRVIDYASDHKLNGLIIWGFLNDQHGGIDSAQRLSRYARERSVRVLPGIGTVCYGGFYHSGNSPWSLTTWMSQHPEVKRYIDEKGVTQKDFPCPSDPMYQKWLRDGAKWFIETFPDIGGVNIEHGDFFACYTPECIAQRAKPENDHNFYWDMQFTEVPIMTTAHALIPDLWYTFATYTGYTKEMMANPPKFLKQFPDYAITQWTYSGMVDHWPADLHAPEGAKHNIGLLHQGSYWWATKAWWDAPGQSYGLIAEDIRKACARALEDGSEGIENEGIIGPASPQNDLNYLAFEEFSWHPKQTLDGWVTERLAPIYGNADLAHRFYQMIGDTTTSASVIVAAKEEALRIASAATDPRAARRWRYLADEMNRRYNLVATPQPKTVSVAPGLNTLQAAIDDANASDTLELQNGEYEGNVIFSKSIAVKAAALAYPTIRFSAASTDRPWQCNAPNSAVVMERIKFVFDRGCYTGLLHAWPNVANCAMTLNDCSITDTTNTGKVSYGIYSAGAKNSPLTMNRCVVMFRTDHAFYTDMPDALVMVKDSKIDFGSSNVSTGLLPAPGHMRFERCIVDGSRAQKVFVMASLEKPEASLDMINCAISYSSEATPMGILNQHGGNASFQHCTIVDRNTEGANMASAFITASSIPTTGTLTVKDCIFDAVAAAPLMAWINADLPEASNFEMKNSIRFDIGSNLVYLNVKRFKEKADAMEFGKMIVGDPKLKEDKIHLQAGSAAIDAAPGIGIKDDIDNVSRPQGKGYDFGCSEFK